MKKCNICKMEFEGNNDKCSTCLSMLEPVKPIKKEVKETKKIIDEKIDKTSKKEISNCMNDILIGYIDYLLSTGQKYVISPKHEKTRIFNSIKEYEETTEQL